MEVVRVVDRLQKSSGRGSDGEEDKGLVGEGMSCSGEKKERGQRAVGDWRRWRKEMEKRWWRKEAALCL